MAMMAMAPEMQLLRRRYRIAAEVSQLLDRTTTIMAVDVGGDVKAKVLR